MPVPALFKRQRRALNLSFLLLSLAAAGEAPAQDGGWRDQHGRPVRNSDAMQSAQGFSASLLVTADADWQSKWNTPADTSPSFKSAELVHYGEKVALLIFFANPKVDAQGKVNVHCDIEVIQPSGAIASSQTGLPCFEGSVSGSPSNVFMARPTVQFTGDATDPVGKWTFKVTVRDDNRPVALRLQTGFELRQ